ncbi:aspartate aminotransferase family protein [Flavobacterium sp. I3-2]|uniref:aspartate aminotransferase family protein n=1 Tax=Flavobacterium sp. I3-2 TaxID=2748319 RepID=UPI0015A81A3A|nr:aspartate aminotransferase family protein [Flavobacterium sp. I3-2]
MKQDFFKYQAQTTLYPLEVEISHAKGSYIYSTDGKKHLDFVAGVSACTLGHSNPKVLNAITEQINKYMHVMVYGEYIQKPAVEFCKLLAENLPSSLNKTYLVNSGTEAVEGAMKLAKRVTGRSQIISCVNAYHGNTQGSMSVLGNEERKGAFRPLLPNVDFITFNNEADLDKITTKTAGIILETIQGSAGFITPKNDFLKKVRAKCDETGTLLILDEIQPGFGRTGKLFGFQNYDMVPDILVMGKGMASGMPVGAFTANEKHMDLLAHDPKCGHITTFGGHPVIAAASLTTLKELLETDLMAQTLVKEQLFRKHLIHPLITDIHGLGLMLAVMTPSDEITNQVILKCKEKGLILFWLMFEGKAIRITPPLTISEEEIKLGCDMIIEALNEVQQEL